MVGGRPSCAVAVDDGGGSDAAITAVTSLLDTALTRRRLLMAGGAAALAAIVGELPGAVTAVRGFVTPAHLLRSSYVPLIGAPFELTAPGRRRVVARLVSVSDLGIGRRMRPLAGADDAFALLFHSSSGSRLEQAVMSIRNPVLGRFELLMSPASTGRRGQDYSAAINRAHPPRL